jgi:hypothetical protein
VHSKTELFLFNSAVGALIISFLAESLPLKVIYSMMFFGGTYYLQLLLFLDKDASVGVSMNARKLKFLYVYMSGLLSALCILFLPPFDAPPTSQPLYVVFKAIPITSFIRVIAGYFLLGAFPGLMLLDTLLSKHKFDVVEKIGLTLALSYAFNTFIGASLIAISLEFLNSLTFITVLLGSLALMRFIRVTLFKTDDSKVKGEEVEGVHLIGKPTKMILLFSSLLLILSSYTLVFSSDVRDIALSGDITRYISLSNEQKLGYTPLYLTDRPLLYVFILAASTLTGLHTFYAYTGLQFYLILFPTSFYILLKALFPNNEKIPPIGAFLSSATSGLGAIGLWDFYMKYRQSDLLGRYQALLDAWAKAPLSHTPYQFYVMPFAYSILFLSLAYLYRSIHPMNGKTEISDIGLCGLLASTLPFTHSIFEFSFFTLSLTILSIYALLKGRFKVLLAIAGTTLTFFIPFELATKTYWFTFTNYLFHIEHFFGYQNPIPTFSSIVILVMASIVTAYMILSKMSRALALPAKSLSIPSFYRVSIKIFSLISAFVLFILTLYYWRADWATLYYPQNLDWPPWYIIILSYGFYLPLTIGMLPIIISVLKKNWRACLFLIVSISSISMLSCLSLFLPSFFTPLTWSRRWSFFAIYFLIITTAIGLTNLPNSLHEVAVKVRLRLKAVKNEMKLPVGQFALLLLIIMLALSNVTALYTTEIFYTSAMVQNNISNAEADALTWLYYNTPSNAVILTFSDSSAKSVSAITARKVLSYSDALSSWPSQLLFNSRLPEVTLYSLKNLGVTHIFVGERDIPILSGNLKGSYLNNLLPALPVVYQKSGFTIYSIPENTLSDDSNYVLVSPTLDFQNTTTSSKFDVFSDKFDGQLDKWVLVSGKWKIVNGTLYEPGQGTFKGKWGLILSNASFSNFIYEYVGRSGKREIQYIWGVFRFADDNNYYSFYIGNTTYQVIEVVNGNPKILSSGGHTLILNLKEWIQVKIEAVFYTIKLYINGKLIATMCGTGLEGRVGLLTHSGYPTYYDDVKVVQLKIPVDSESALTAYQLATSMLLVSGVKFKIVPDIYLNGLERGGVYIFPYNWRMPKNLSRNIQKYISEGAHIIVFDQRLGSFDELDNERQPLLLSTLKLKIGESSQSSGIIFRGSYINLPRGTWIHVLTYDASNQLIVLANYTLGDRAVTPYIIQKRIGSGTITYIHLSDFLNPTKASPILNRELLRNTILTVVAEHLPEPVGEGDISSPVPKNLYKLLNVNDIPTLLELKDVFNYIYVYGSPIIVNGSCSLTSDYILMAAEQLEVVELEISSSTHKLYLKDVNITDLHLNGLVDLSIEASRLILPASYGGVITTLSLPNKFTMHIKLINAKLEFRVGNKGSQLIWMTDGSIKMTVGNSGFSVFKVAVKQPIINMKGVINLPSWHGIFWYEDSAVASFRLHSADIEGELALQLTYTFGGYIFKILSAERVNSVKWHS